MHVELLVFTGHCLLKNVKKNQTCGRRHITQRVKGSVLMEIKVTQLRSMRGVKRFFSERIYLTAICPYLSPHISPTPRTHLQKQRQLTEATCLLPHPIRCSAYQCETSISSKSSEEEALLKLVEKLFSKLFVILLLHDRQYVRTMPLSFA